MANDYKRKIVIVTGLSGAGKSSALRAFEDIGFQAIDNLPLNLLDSMLDTIASEETDVPVAVGVDTRTLHFSPDHFLERVAAIRTRGGFDLHILFMDASTEVLMKRFSETRRSHPLEKGKPLRDAIKEERALMSDVRSALDGILDTSSRTGADTRRVIRQRFSFEKEAKLVVTLMSFGFAVGVPRDVDIVYDVRFLRNPHYVPDLKSLTGLDDKVANYVRADEAFGEFVSKVSDFIEFLLPRYQLEGKSYLTIAFGCTGGQHRSVMMAETMAAAMHREGLTLNIFHRELEPDART